jgi:uncharacterized protein
MLIHELTKHESLNVLTQTHLARLACVRDMQPYIVPIHFAYQHNWIYSFSVLGQKINWMRANPLVCLEVDQMRREQWSTVVVFGRYEELCDSPEFRSERMYAFELLQKRPMWWDIGGVNVIPGRAPAVVPILYRIKVDQITGRSATPEHPVLDAKHAKADNNKQGWLRKVFQRNRKT